MDLPPFSPDDLRNAFRLQNNPLQSQASEESSGVDVSSSSSDSGGEDAVVVRTFATEEDAIKHAKKDGTLHFNGTYRSGTGSFTKYFHCRHRAIKQKGQPKPITGCRAQTNVVKSEPNVNSWTVEVKSAHQAECAHHMKLHGIPRSERNRLTSTYDKPSAAQADRATDLPDLSKLRCAFQYDAKRDGKLFDLSAEEIRQTLIADNRKHFDASEEPWLQSLIVRVERWEANGAHERVVLITTPALMQLAEKYEVGGIDATYKVSPRQSCVMVFGVYHDRAFLPIALAISSSRTPGVLPKKGFGSKGETEQHYARFLGLIKEMCPGFQPKYFVRDAARQIHNAIEALWPGVLQCTCWFHVEQCIEQWFQSPAGVHLRSGAAEMKSYLVHVHFAKADAQQGLELLCRDWPLTEFWEYMVNAQRMPGQVQSNWTRESFAAGAPVTASGLEHMNSILKTYFKKKRINSMTCGTTLARFIFDTDTKTSRLNSQGIPRQLESYYIDRRAEKLLSWTRGLALVPLILSTASFDHEGVTHWATLKGELPITAAEAQARQLASGDSFVAWMAWQDVRVFSVNSCTCPWHQNTAFCKHVAAARAATEGLRIPPTDVIGPRAWIKKLNAFLVQRPHASVHGVAHVAAEMIEDRGRRMKRTRPAVAGRGASPTVRAHGSRSPRPLVSAPRSGSRLRLPPGKHLPPSGTSVGRTLSESPLRGPPVSPNASEMVRGIKDRTRSPSQGYVNK